MKSAGKAFCGKFGCVLLLAAFVFAVTSDPITDAVTPHDDCAICALVAHQMAPADPGPVLSCALVETSAVVEDAPLPALRVEHPVHLSRGPPAS